MHSESSLSHLHNTISLGFQFQGKYFYEKMLSMGAAPSCQIFEAFSSSLQWILKTKYNITCIKVLDDFLFVQPSHQLCHRHLQIFQQLCEYLHIPIAPHKTHGPATTLTFLGLQLDTLAMQARLPPDKLLRYSENIEHALKKTLSSCET